MTSTSATTTSRKKLWYGLVTIEKVGAVAGWSKNHRQQRRSEAATAITVTRTLDTAVFERTVGSLLGYTTGGDDILFGGNGNDRLLGGVGRDTVSGDAGADQLFGDTDSYYVASGNMAWIPPEFHAADVLNGGAGDDHLLGGGGVDELYGGSDNDFLSGDQLNAGNASIALAYHGNDYLDGGERNQISGLYQKLGVNRRAAALAKAAAMKLGEGVS